MVILDRKLLRDLVAWRGTLGAIVVIVACGVATFVAMQSVYDSLSLTQTRYYETYRFGRVFASLTRAPESVAARIAAIPGVRAVQTRVVADVVVDLPGRTDGITARLISIPETGRPALDDLYLREGRMLRPGASDEVLVSEAFARANGLRVGDRLAAVINRRYRRLRIVGIALSPEYVYEIRGAADVWPDNRHFGVIWAARKPLAAAFDLTGAFNDVVVGTAPADADAVIAAMDRILAPYGSTGAYGARDQASHRFLSDEIAQLRVQAVFIPAVFLGIAAFLLDIAVSRLVSTQREQIAILKALGIDTFTLLRHYTKLVILVVAVGVAAGVLLGAWLGLRLTVIYTRFFHFPLLAYRLHPAIVAEAAAIACTAALAGTAIAMVRAARLAPAEAMRPPSPPLYRATLLERLGAAASLPLAARMIARNLERRSWTALGTVLAIAFGVAMLVVGRYGSDAIAFMIDLQFRTIQREDVTLTFSRPVRASARYELAALPGVRAVEPFRALAVRLRAGHRSRRVALLGLPDPSPLLRITDRNLVAHRVPPRGLLLSAQLARLLGITAGEAVTLEVLEGRRIVRTVPVAAVIDDVLGLNAYMNDDALHRLLDEDRTINGAYLAVDPRALDAFDRRAKGLPLIAGIAYRESMLQQFERTIAESMGISIAFLIGFAAAIACGVIYNAGRIVLSERARELATLRILGYSQREIATLVFGELAVLAAAAVPLGWGIGYALCLALAPFYETDVYRLPVVVTPASYAFAAAVAAACALLSSVPLASEMRKLDLQAVLKAVE